MAIQGFGIPAPLKALAGLGQPFSIQAGQTEMIPAGHFFVLGAPYTFLQFLDPISQLWRNVSQAFNNAALFVNSDGSNFRFANLAGCPVGAVVTAAGSGYTAGSPPTLTASAGGSKWKAIVGGLLNTAVTVPTNAGTNYTYPPLVVISPPPVGGLQATAIATLSGSAVTSVTIINQGAGYVVPPTALFVTDERDPNNPITNPATTTPVTPAGISVNVQGLLGVVGMAGPLVPGVILLPSSQVVASPFTLTGAGTVAAVVNTDPGSPVTAVPTLTFSAGAATATVLCNFAVTGFTVAAGGVAYGNAQPFMLLSTGGLSAATPIYTNPATEKGITQTRMAQITGTSTAGGAIQTTGAITNDAGIGFQTIPTLAVIPAGNSLPTTIAQATATVGAAQNDLVYLIPAD